MEHGVGDTTTAVTDPRLVHGGHTRGNAEEQRHRRRRQRQGRLGQIDALRHSEPGLELLEEGGVLLEGRRELVQTLTKGLTDAAGLLVLSE